MQFRFCEPVWATPYSKWHIRKAKDDEPMKLGGGAGPPLCFIEDDKEWTNGWDLDVELTKHHLTGKHVCQRCVELLKEKKAR